MSRIEQGALVWDRYDIEAVHLSHTASILLLQGMGVTELFPTNGFFSATDGQKGGPIYYLAGHPAAGDAPQQIVRVVLARIVSAPEGLSVGALLGKLVETVLGAR